jgi:hypothetical protein
LVERLVASWVSGRVHSWVEGEKQDMEVGKGMKGNMMAFHMFLDIEMNHT